MSENIEFTSLETSVHPTFVQGLYAGIDPYEWKDKSTGEIKKGYRIGLRDSILPTFFNKKSAQIDCDYDTAIFCQKNFVLGESIIAVALSKITPKGNEYPKGSGQFNVNVSFDCNNLKKPSLIK